MRKTMLLLAAALVASPAYAQTFDAVAAKARIDASLDKNYPELDALYKDLHSHPEVGFQEERTAALLAAKMRKLGFTVTEHVGKTGVVAIYKNGPGPVVMVRTELDALPMEEKTGLPYASKAQQTVDGKLTYTDHACGHDSHMAWWVGTAQALLAMKDQWHGTLMFIGQPAEEIISAPGPCWMTGFYQIPQARLRLCRPCRADAAGRGLGKAGRGDLGLGHAGGDLPWRGRAWLDARQERRSGGDGRALRGGYPDRHQPPKRSPEVRRGDGGRLPGGHGGQHHSRSCRSATLAAILRSGCAQAAE
jgi:hypothetical protein